MAIKILDIELTEPILPIKTEGQYSRYRILLRFHTVPVGWIYLSNPEGNLMLTSSQLCEAIQLQLSQSAVFQALSRRMGLAIPPKESFEPISIIVCTRNRKDFLEKCVASLLKLEYPEYEIIVVDNAPSDDETYNFVSSIPVRYAREPKPGLDRARNKGIEVAKFELIAFTDDDVQVDRHWLHRINNAFQDEGTMCVTGYVAPAALDTIAQMQFELGYGGMGHGFKRQVAQRSAISEERLIWSSSYGVGANMAFRKKVFDSIGLFDVALDVGTPSHGGGDIEMFQRVIHHGHVLVYDPSVLVWHTHRSSRKALRKQLTDNGRSFGCYLITGVKNNVFSAKGAIRFLLTHWLQDWILKNMFRRKPFLPRYIPFFEIYGMMLSPFAYWSAQREAKRINKRSESYPEKISENFAKESASYE